MSTPTTEPVVEPVTTTEPTPVTTEPVIVTDTPPPDLGRCFLVIETGKGTTEWAFLPCDESYHGEIVLISRPNVAPPTTTVGRPTETLPETGVGTTSLGVLAAIFVLGGAAFRFVSRRAR